MSVFGIAPLGTGPGPAGGPGLITVLGLLPLSNNKWIVVFDTPPQTIDVDASSSGTNEENYVLQAIDPTIIAQNGDEYVPPGEYVPSRFPYCGKATQDFDDPTQIVCDSDSTLQEAVDYQVTISPNICGAEGQTFAGPNVFEFRAPLLPLQPLLPVEISEEKFRDFDYIVNPEPGEVGGTYRIESSGDIGIQDAETSLRKRIYRRIFTDPGAFAFFPQYGVGMAVKRLAKSGSLQGLSNRIAQQIQLEPDVVSAGVEVRTQRTNTGNFVEVTARVERLDARTRTFVFREPLV